MDYAFDPELVPILEFLPTTSLEDPVATRAEFDGMIAQLNAALDDSGVHVQNRTIPGPPGAPEVAVRIYTPQGLSDTVPGLLYLHGGGFVIGSLESEQGNCLALCRDLGIVIVSVDYRLAPETPYPGGLDDCYCALQWVSDNSAALSIDADRLGIFGQSAGGGLSAATALLARDRKGPRLCFQYLSIPEVDDRLDTPSMQQFVDTPVWNRHKADMSWDYYLGSDYKRGAVNVPYYAAPARAQDLTGLPPAHVTTMEFDPLRDEGILYALKLMQAGVSTELHSYPGTFHGSSLMPSAAVSQREATEMRLALRRGLRIQNTDQA
jgi:acetyl esterase